MEKQARERPPQPPDDRWGSQYWDRRKGPNPNPPGYGGGIGPGTH